MSDVLEQMHNLLMQLLNPARSLTTKANHSSFTQLSTAVSCYYDTIICSKQFRYVKIKFQTIESSWFGLVVVLPDLKYHHIEDKLLFTKKM